MSFATKTVNGQRWPTHQLTSYNGEFSRDPDVLERFRTRDLRLEWGFPPELELDWTPSQHGREEHLHLITWLTTTTTHRSFHFVNDCKGKIWGNEWKLEKREETGLVIRNALSSQWYNNNRSFTTTKKTNQGRKNTGVFAAKSQTCAIHVFIATAYQ